MKNPETFRGRDPSFYENQEVLPKVHKKLVATVRRIGKEHGVSLIAINHLFEEYTHGDSLFFDTIHFSDAGNKVTAEGIAQWILTAQKNEGL